MTVAVGTYGSSTWDRLAKSRAIPSAKALGVPVVHAHGSGWHLHDARNRVLAEVHTKWVIFLDADDELEAGYVEAMATGTADVRAPSVRYIRGSVAAWPKMPKVAGHTHDCIGDCLLQGNWLVIGACVRTDLAQRIRWRDFPIYEDWDYWVQCYLAGATFEAIPGATYRAHARRGSRNRSGSHALKMATHRAIEAANGLGPGGVRL